jgi:hypothetical protein
LKQAINA